MADSTAENKTKALLANGDKNLVVTDNTKNDVSTAAHGFCPKAPNDTAKFLRGDATWAAPNDGVWTSVTYASGNFTASGSMTWTVEEADVSNFQYMIIGKTMWVNFWLALTSVGGTLSDTLKIKIPANKVSANAIIVRVGFLNDNGTVREGRVQANAGSTTLDINLHLGGNFAASTNATYVVGQIFFEIQ